MLAPMRILLVEDEPALRESLAKALRADGHAVDTAGNRLQAELEMRVTDYRLVILDRGLPDGDGLETLRRWRKAGRTLPVLVLTARDALHDRIDGLDGGADDYVLKPFDLDELRARVRMLARRAPALQSVTLEAGDLVLHTARAEVRRGGVLLPLRAKELAVLQVLLERRGHAVSRAQLREACWDADHEPGSNVEEAVISALRRKLGEPPLIRTRRGLGYTIDD
jgi:two-component system copper resistance phosphate regulon response regulator CusR